MTIGFAGAKEPYPPGDSGESIDTLSTPDRRRSGWQLPAAGPILGWVVAAAMAAAAPFGSLNTLVVQFPNGRVRHASIDGWGRDHPDQALQTVGHGVRFGIALWVCAAGLVIAAVLCAVRARRLRQVGNGDDLTRQAVIASIAAPSSLAGVIGSMGLSAHNYVDMFKAIAAARESTITGGEAVYRAGYGGCLWLSLAALACALLSSFAYLRSAGATSTRARSNKQ